MLKLARTIIHDLKHAFHFFFPCLFLKSKYHCCLHSKINMTNTEGYEPMINTTRTTIVQCMILYPYTLICN